MREGKSVKLILILQTRAVIIQLGRLLPYAARHGTWGQYWPSSNGSSSGCGRTESLDYKLYANRAASPGWTDSGEFLNLPLQTFHTEREIKKNRLLLNTRSSDAARKNFCVSTLGYFWATACLKNRHSAQRRCVEVAYLVVKEIPSTAPTSVDPCPSTWPARWLMEATYVTNISVPKSLGRQTEALQLRIIHCH